MIATRPRSRPRGSSAVVAALLSFTLYTLVDAVRMPVGRVLPAWSVPSRPARSSHPPRPTPSSEHQHLAQTLHDYPLQEIYAALFLLELEERRTGVDLSQMHASLTRAVTQLRCMCRGIHPADGTPSCLVQGLRELVSAYRSDERGPTITLCTAGVSELALPDTEELLAIARGALVNGLRHSGARAIRLELRVQNDAVVLQVSDNGVGFLAPQDLAALPAGGQYGLASMVQRARAIGAACELDTAPGRGTAVHVRLPLRGALVGSG